MKNYAIILASGTGSRYGSSIPKQFEKIADYTILEHTINAFENCSCIDNIIVVITPEYREYATKIINQNSYRKIYKIVEGGDIRKKSSMNGINAIEDTEANVLIHDCARPFISPEIIENCVEALKTHNAVGVAIPCTDTIIEVNDGFIKNIPPRETLMNIQTPQCFKLSLIKEAHRLSADDNNFTDDCGLILKQNLSEIFIIEGERTNIKLTYPEDIFLAKIYSEKISHTKKHLS